MKLELHIIVSLIFDFGLLIAGLFAADCTKKIGKGINHKSLRIVTAGFVVLAIAHLLETVGFIIFKDLLQIEGEILEVVEMTHRILVLLSLSFIVYGYKKLAEFVRS